MKGQALFIGKRNIDRKERKDIETGMIIIPAFKGTQFYFYSADWDEDAGELFGMGKSRTQTVSEEDLKDNKYEELNALEIGEMVTVVIQETFSGQNSYNCKFLKCGW